MVFNVDGEESINTLINSLLRGAIKWEDVKTLFIKQEGLIIKKQKDLVTVIVIEKPSKNALKEFNKLGLHVHKNDIVKIDRDTYLKLRQTNIIREVKLGK